MVEGERIVVVRDLGREDQGEYHDDYLFGAPIFDVLGYRF